MCSAAVVTTCDFFEVVLHKLPSQVMLYGTVAPCHAKTEDRRCSRKLEFWLELESP